tara:strand:+ start:1316 stop:1465 length:150 start_codon:yes stop_codon:yes gene_type:complete
MVSNKELQDVVAQVNSSYTVLLNKITKLEAEMELLSSSNTLSKKSKEKS